MFTENRSRRNEVYLFDTRFRLVSSRYFAALSKYSRESGDARSSVVVGSLHCARDRAENATLETSHRQLRLFRRFNRYSTCPPPPPPSSSSSSAYATSLANTAVESPFCQGFPCLVIPRGVLRTCTHGLDSLPPATNTKIAIGPGAIKASGSLPRGTDPFSIRLKRERENAFIARCSYRPCERKSWSRLVESPSSLHRVGYPESSSTYGRKPSRSEHLFHTVRVYPLFRVLTPLGGSSRDGLLGSRGKVRRRWNRNYVASRGNSAASMEGRWLAAVDPD